MEYQQRRETVAQSELLFDGCRETPVDLDLTLPDYCPDIQKILKCEVTPAVSSAAVLGESLDVGGSVVLRVLYLDPEGTRIRCCENTSSYTARLPVRSLSGNGVPRVRTHVEYVNCRAVSPRRLEIHGSFSVCADVWEQREIDLLCGVEDPDVEQQTTERDVSVCAGLSRQEFTVGEVLELGDGKPDAEMILRSQAIAVTDDLEREEHQVTAVGRILLKVLYLPDLTDDTPETMEYELPFRQNLDCGFAGEGADLSVFIDVQGTSVRIKSDAAGENSLLEAEVTLAAAAQAYETKTVTLLTDAYSRSVEVALEHRQQTFRRFLETVEETAAEKQTVSVSESGISRVLDLWNEGSTVSGEIRDGELLCRGKYDLCLLALDQEGRPFYLERTFEMQHASPCRGEGTPECRVSCEAGNIGYRITGGTSVEVKTELRLRCDLYSTETLRCVAEVVPREDLPRNGDQDSSLVLYYAKAGETLWDIAKRYAAGVSEIREENGMDDAVIDRPVMLMIPV